MQTHRLRRWGLGGAFVAAVFATWMLLFPSLVAPYFAWPAEPRLGQVFIAAGYIFRTGFFLSVAREPLWYRVRWIFWGNLVFTGTLLLATFLNAAAFNWTFPTAYIWLFLYVAEPIAMIYLAPPKTKISEDPLGKGAPIAAELKLLLIVETAVLGTIGAFLVLNPEFVSGFWPWALKPLGARIIAAWFLGWAMWAGTLAFAHNWDEIRIGVGLNILFGLAIVASILIFFPLFDFSRTSTLVYVGGAMVLTLLLILLYWRNNRRRTNV